MQTSIFSIYPTPNEIRFNQKIPSTNRKIVEIILSGIRLRSSSLETIEIRFETRRLIDSALSGLRICRNIRAKGIGSRLQARLGCIQGIVLRFGLVILRQIQSYGIGGLLCLGCGCHGTIGGSLCLGDFSGNAIGSRLKTRLGRIYRISLGFGLIVLGQIDTDAIRGLLCLRCGCHGAICGCLDRLDIRRNGFRGLSQRALGRICLGNIDLQLIDIALSLVRTGLRGIGCVLRCGRIADCGICRRLGLTGSGVRCRCGCLCVIGGGLCL